MGLTPALTLPAVRSGRHIRFIWDRYSTRTYCFHIWPVSADPARGQSFSLTDTCSPQIATLGRQVSATGSLTLETGAS